MGEVRKRGLKTGIVTGSPSHIAEMEVGLVGKELFDAVVIARKFEGVKEKPHPDGLESASKR